MYCAHILHANFPQLHSEKQDRFFHGEMKESQYRCEVTNGTVRSENAARTKTPRLTLKHGQTTRRCAGIGELSSSEQTWLNVRRTSAAQSVATNSLLGHRRMTEKGAEHVHIGWLGNWSVRSTQVEEQRKQLECAISASKCPTPVVRASVCSKHFCHAEVAAKHEGTTSAPVSVMCPVLVYRPRLPAVFHFVHRPHHQWRPTSKHVRLASGLKPLVKFHSPAAQPLGSSCGYKTRIWYSYTPIAKSDDLAVATRGDIVAHAANLERRSWHAQASERCSRPCEPALRGTPLALKQ